LVPDKPRQLRNRNLPLKVFVTPDERAELQERARQAGLRMSHYLRAAGLSAPVRSVLDLKTVADLAKVSADQGRLGGLLKMYLQDRDPDRRTAQRLLADIEAVQSELRATLRRIAT
jgi:hypothetical protein